MPAFIALIQGALFGFLTSFTWFFVTALVRMGHAVTLSASLAKVDWLLVGLISGFCGLLWMSIRHHTWLDLIDGGFIELLGYLLEGLWKLIAAIFEGIGGGL